MDYFVTRYDVDPEPGAGCIVLEDSIMHKGRPATAGSKMLENFISPLDATVVTRLEAAGIHILGKTKMDEFGVSGLFIDPELSDCGQAEMDFRSCPGAVSAVADGVAPFALCNDYTGAVSRHAASHKLWYIHPTYGTVSRYGLIPAVQSMDQIGIVCKTPSEGFRILEIIAGYDEKDGAMFQDEGKLKIKSEKLRIGVPMNVYDGALPDAAAIGMTGKGLQNAEIVEFELKYFDVYAAVMQILCSGELSNNITRYDGIKFGHRAKEYGGLKELYTKSRTEGFREDTKLAAMLGAMVLSQGNYSRYYDKAMRIRRLVKESLDFGKYDIIAMPGEVECCPLAFHALPRLCGLPALTMPLNGGTFIANAGCEADLRSLVASG